MQASKVFAINLAPPWANAMPLMPAALAPERSRPRCSPDAASQSHACRRDAVANRSPPGETSSHIMGIRGGCRIVSSGSPEVRSQTTAPPSLPSGTPVTRRPPHGKILKVWCRFSPARSRSKRCRASPVLLCHTTINESLPTEAIRSPSGKTWTAYTDFEWPTSSSTGVAWVALQTRTRPSAPAVTNLPPCGKNLTSRIV
mmetsp:Transcript_36958/g.105125  ORF Transcript_36958/g.105125 Transcript_36958/m.105125 type:complete len:200 (+) Transcript_36958:492-1091(+)